MLGNEEVQAIRNNAFRIYCPEMRLRSRSSEFPHYEGPGTISQDENGHLRFELFDQTQEADPMSIPGFGAPGALIPEEHYYQLLAVDGAERRWSTDRVLPNQAGRADRRGVMCYGRLREIECPESGEWPSALRLFIPGSFDLPANRFTDTVLKREGVVVAESSRRDAWHLAFPRLTITIMRQEEGLLLDAVPADGDFSPQLDTRLEETLWFVLGRPCSWQVKMERRKGEGVTGIRSRIHREIRLRVQPPVDWVFNEEGSQGELFQRYLTYIEEYKEPRFHPTSVNVLQVLRASAQTIEAEALALGVAVESLINREYSDWKETSPEEVAQVDSLISLVSTSDVTPAMKKRAVGALGMIKGPSAGSCLRKLQQDGHVSVSAVKAWEKIRNCTAHGRDIEEPFEEIVRLCDETYGLFNLLIFSRVGYSGTYTDRSRPGWRTVQCRPFWRERTSQP